jgi:hypothetical protein
LIAFLDKSDSYHPLFRRLFSQPPALVTSALVVAEGHGWFLRRYERHRAVQFLAFIDALPMLTISSVRLAGTRARKPSGQEVLRPETDARGRSRARHYE